MQKKVSDTIFRGFPKESAEYLENLNINNTREWFHDNKEAYEKYYLAPAFAFTNSLGAALAKKIKGLVYEARVNRSVFRINRDTRYSKDKSPYKSHMGIVFWKGPYADRHMNPGFYFQLEPHGIFMACGTWMPEKEVIEEYRKSLLDDKLAAEFKKQVDGLEAQGIFLNRDSMLKKVPRGFPADHSMAEYAKYKTIYVEMREIGLPDIVHTPEFVDYCMAFFSKPVGLLSWLADMTERAYKG